MSDWQGNIISGGIPNIGFWCILVESDSVVILLFVLGVIGAVLLRNAVEEFCKVRPKLGDALSREHAERKALSTAEILETPRLAVNQKAVYQREILAYLRRFPTEPLQLVLAKGWNPRQAEMRQFVQLQEEEMDRHD